MTNTVNSNSALYNEDLAPIPQEKRKWSWINYSTVWMGMVHNIVAYEAAAALIGQGFSALQAIIAVFVANVILVLAMWLNGVAGAKYGVPFPVLIRAAFGYRGAQIPVLLRAFVAIFWFAVQSYAGSLAINALFLLLIPGWNTLSHFTFLGLSANVGITFALFWLLHALVISHGMDRIRHFELWAGPAVLVVGMAGVIWTIWISRGLGPLFSQPSHLSAGAFDVSFPLAVTALIGVWASLILNIPDFTRHAKSQRDQVLGQAIGLPITAILFSLISIITTSGTVVAFGRPIANPVTLLQQFHNPVVLVVGALTIIIATLSVNIAANVVSPAYDLINLLPQRLNFESAGIVTIILGVGFMPWLWFNHASAIFGVLGAIGGALGPVFGIMAADFYIVRQQTYSVSDLFSVTGRFAYQNGWNVKGLLAFVVGLIGAFIGLIVPALHFLYAYSWFVGVVLSFVGYVWLMKGEREAGYRVSLDAEDFGYREIVGPTE